MFCGFLPLTFLHEKVQRANKIWGGVYKRETEANKQPNILIVLSNSSLCFKASVTRDWLSLSASNYLFVSLHPYGLCSSRVTQI